MKMIKLEVSPSTAKSFLGRLDAELREKNRALAELQAQVRQLEIEMNEIRSQLNSELLPNTERNVKGSNRDKISDYLNKLPTNRGAGISEISKATGVPISSVSFVLKKGPDVFAYDKAARKWRMKQSQLEQR